MEFRECSEGPMQHYNYYIVNTRHYVLSERCLFNWKKASPKNNRSEFGEGATK